MNTIQLVYVLLLLSLFLIFIEFYKLRRFTFIINILILYLILEISLQNDLWHIIFLSNNLWRSIILFLIIISFIIVLNLIKDYKFEVLFLNLMVLLGSIVVVTCDNLIILYLGLELQTFSLFILISKNKNSIRGTESSLKYFILGALSSGIFLLGVSFVFSFGLSFSLKDLFFNFGFDSSMNYISCLLICLSLFFKLALFPLHFWIADIYEGSSWEVISLISTIPKISVLSIILQILNSSNFFIISAVISIVIGTMGALNQTKLKRLLAYSGISHMGFIMLGFGLLSNQGYEASFIYLLIYIFTVLGIFLLVSKTNFTKNYFIIELGGLNLVNKITAISWLIFFLSIAGVPPLSGFISKWIILAAMVNYKYLLPIIIGITFSAIGAGYYLRVVKIAYFQKSSSFLSWKHILKPKAEVNIIPNYLLGILIYLSLVVIIHPTTVFFPFYLCFNYFF